MTSMSRSENIEFFISSMAASLPGGGFVKLSLGRYTGTDTDLKNILARKIIVKRQEKLSLTYRYRTRDIVKNYDFPEAAAILRAALHDGFRTGMLYTTDFDLSLDKTLKKMPPTQTAPASTNHDRPKKSMIGTAGKPYLHSLNITDANGAVFKSAQDKFRQINKFVEIMSGLIMDMPKGNVNKVADMGAGKGYLTFALYDYMQSMGLRADVTGVEYRADLVDLCNKIAHDSRFERLRFVQGSIENYDAAGTNVLIALHACDTATDDAIAKGIKAGADLIVVAPCCHKQIRRALEQSKAVNDLDFMTRHGTFLERHAEMLTDGLRGLILEYYGYRVKIFEFISDAHTPKNVLIVGVRGPVSDAGQKRLLAELQRKKQYFGVGRHYLETLLDL